LYRSSDDGRTWHDTKVFQRLCNRNTSRPNEGFRLPVRASGQLVVFGSCGDLQVEGDVGADASSDDGATWHPIRLPGVARRGAVLQAQEEGGRALALILDDPTTNNSSSKARQPSDPVTITRVTVGR
jgi:hypothetical protein